MTHQDDLHSADAAPEQPTMELLDGAEAAPPACCSLGSRLLRGSLYGVLLLSATALLAVSAVPELAMLIPENRPQTACQLSSASCSTLDVASLQNVKGSPCCPLEAATAKRSGCSRSCADKALASVSADLGECCDDLGECCEKSGSGCEKSGECPLTLAEGSTEADEQSVGEDALAKLPASVEPGPPAPPVAE